MRSARGDLTARSEDGGRGGSGWHAALARAALHLGLVGLDPRRGLTKRQDRWARRSSAEPRGRAAQQLAAGLERARDGGRMDVLVRVRGLVVVRHRVGLSQQGYGLLPLSPSSRSRPWADRVCRRPASSPRSGRSAAICSRWRTRRSGAGRSWGRGPLAHGRR